MEMDLWFGKVLSQLFYYKYRKGVNFKMDGDLPMLKEDICCPSCGNKIEVEIVLKEV